MLKDEEEKKRREEEAKSIISTNSIGESINSINYANANNLKIETQNDDEQFFIDRVNEANSIINSINPRQNVELPAVSDEDRMKSRQNAQKIIDLMDSNEENDIANNLTNTSDSLNTNVAIVSHERKNKIKSKEEIDKQIKSAQTQGATNPNTNNQLINNDIKIGLANEKETQNAQELSTLDIQAMKEANKKNENIEKGGIDAFNEWADTTLNNILGGAKQSISGLVNVFTTATALGIKGLEGASRIIGLEEQANNLKDTRNDVVDFGSDINKTANYERSINAQIDNDFVKTSGDVSNVISNMMANYAIGYVSGIPSTVVQGLSVGGNSAQEVLDENKDNVEQATLTGIAKGYVSYLTEKMFDANILTRGTKKTSIQEGINRLISNRINSKLGKEFANRFVGILGENVEELAEDNAGYLIDRLINNKDLPGFEEWWNNTTETAKTTTLSTMIMGLLGLGGESFSDIEMDMETEHWVKEAQKIIEKENLAIHFNPNEIVDLDKTKTFYVTRFTQDGELANIVPTQGKPIYNPKTSLNVIPVVVKDSQTNSYNVIDGNTGVILDNTYYATTMEAEGGFNQKANKLTDLQVKDINTKIDEANYLITDKIINTIAEAKKQLAQDNITSKTNNTNYTQEQFNDVTKLINQIQDKTIYNKSKANNIFRTVANNINNISIVLEDGTNYIKSYDSNGNETHQEKLSNKVFTGSKIKEIVNNAIQYADISFSNQTQNINTSQSYQNQNASTFYNTELKYAIDDVKKVTEPFNAKKSYTKNELADIWNNEIAENEYDVSYDRNGNIQNYIVIEEDENNLMVSLYDSEDNMVKSETISNKNGKYSSNDITDAIEKVSSLYDENRPIKGQQDIEGNEVRNMKQDNKTDERIREILKYNQDGREIKDQNYIDFMVKRYKDNKNISNIDIDTKMVENLLAEKSSKNDKLRKLYAEINNSNNITLKVKLENAENHQLEDVNLDIDITLSGIRESFSKSSSNEKYAIVPYLDKLIETMEDGNGYFKMIDEKQRDNIKGFFYLFNTAKINGKLYAIKMDIKRTTIGDRFYVHRVSLINNEEASIQANDLSKSYGQVGQEAPSINNSISQKTETVKSDKNTAINKFTQKDGNNTNFADENVRNMKKTNSNNTTKTTTDNQGRELSKQQQHFFKDSKVRDEKGNLLVVYHGTEANVDIPKEYWFNIFDIDKAGKNGNMLGDGFYFTSNKSHAEQYAHLKGNIYKTYLNIKNPLEVQYFSTGDLAYSIRNINPYIEADIYKKDGTIDGYKVRKYLLDNGYDGIHSGNTYVAFNSNQIKNVDNINPTANDDIRYLKSNKISKPSKTVLKSIDDIEGKYKSQTDYMILNEDDNYINIRNLVVKEDLRNNGIGQSILNDIIRYANQTGKTITLTPTNAFNTKAKLQQWYKKNGFVKNSGKNANFIISDTMYKLPENNTIEKIIDNQGRKLSKQQQEYFKDSKVRDEKGNLKTLYHGTPYNFNIFKYDKLGENTSSLGAGFYFTDIRETGEAYKREKGNLKEVYVDITKPLSYGKTTITKTEYKKFIEAINKETKGTYLEDYGGIDEALMEYEYGGDDIDLINSVHNASGLSWKKTFDILRNTTGFDGIISEKGFLNKGETLYVVFNSNQIKNVDNNNPTSNEDIRFTKRTAKTTKQDLETKRNAERQGAYIEQEIQKIEKTGNWDNSIPITRMSDIRKTIENYLGLGIKKGHFRQQAYAIYKSNRDVIRTKELKDMDSILHETGHALDLGDRLKVDKEAIADELLRAIDKLGGYENETREIRLEEGFAEVIREYSIIPEQAKAEYPQTVSIIEGIRKADKSFDTFISKVQEQTYNYIHQNPRNRTLSNVSIGEQTDKAPLTKNWLKQEIMRNIYDKDWVVKSVVNEMQKANGKTINQLKASNNAYYLTRLATGIGDKVTSMLSDGYINEQGNKLMPGLNQIGEILGNDPQRFDDLRAYLVARRDTDYKSKTLKTGIRSMDSKAVIEQFKNDTQIQEASKLIYDTLDGVMQYAVNNGLITQETADNLKESNAFYVPMQRVLENKGNQVGRRGAVVDIVKARTGSELDIKDVLENIIANSSNVIQQVENNNILKALYYQGKEVGITGAIYDVIDTPVIKTGTAKLETWKGELEKQGIDTSNIDLDKTIDLFAPNNKVDSQNLITSFINENGKRVYLQFNDEVLFNSLMNMDKKFMSQVLKINSKMNMPLRYGATMANIGFAIPNMISDTAQATIYSTAGFIPVVDNALGVLDILATTNKTVGNFVNKVAPQYAERINKLYALYNQSGATNSTRLSQYRDSTQNVMKDVYGSKKSETLGIKEKYKPLKRLLDLMTYIPEISEQSTRFEVFKKNYEYYKDKGNSEMDTRIMAALESRDATQDFGRTGNITREINQLIPFSAARVGSAYTFAEKVKANPKQVGMRIALLTALAMAIKGLGYDDKEIEELNQRKKDDNFVFKIGDNIITIKKPQGILRSIINLAEYIQDLSTGHIEEGKEGERLGEWINNAIMDNMPADSVTGLVPNMVAPLIENAINKDFYYNTDIVKNYDLELPDAEQYYDYNSQLAILLGKIFNYSPAKIDNLISGYFGGLGTQITNTIDSILGKIGITTEKPEMGAENNAIGKRFVVNVNSNSASIDEIYNRKTELTKKKNGGTITDNEAEELETITNAIGNMSKLNKQIKEIKKDLSLSGKEKAEKIKLLQQQKTDTARQALGKDSIYPENENTIQDIQFYPSSSTLKKNGYSLELSSEQKKEYEQIASEYYNKNKSLYNKEKQDNLKSKAKDYAKNKLMQKYKTSLVKSK